MENPNIEDEAAVIALVDYLLQTVGLPVPPPDTMAELVDDAYRPLAPGGQGSGAAGFGDFGHFGHEAIDAARFVIEAIVAAIHLKEIKHLMGPKVLLLAQKGGSALKGMKPAGLTILVLSANPQIGRELWDTLPASVHDEVADKITSAVSQLKCQNLSQREREALEPLEKLMTSLKKK